MSLAGLAVRAGVSEAELKHLESGAGRVGQTRLEALARALGCLPVDLLIHDPIDPEGIWTASASARSCRRAVRPARRHP